MRLCKSAAISAKSRIFCNIAENEPCPADLRSLAVFECLQVMREALWPLHGPQVQQARARSAPRRAHAGLRSRRAVLTPRSGLSCASRPPSGGRSLGLIAGPMKNGTSPPNRRAFRSPATAGPARSAKPRSNRPAPGSRGAFHPVGPNCLNSSYPRNCSCSRLSGCSASSKQEQEQEGRPVLSCHPTRSTSILRNSSARLSSRVLICFQSGMWRLSDA